MPNTIVLKGDPIQREDKAAEAITPGELLEYNSSGNLQPHSSAAANAQPRFAVENELFGEDYTTDYKADDQVMHVTGQQGDEVYAWLAGLENVNKGADLESDGNGALQAYDTGSPEDDGVVAYAAEAVNNSGSSARTRIKVEVA